MQLLTSPPPIMRQMCEGDRISTLGRYAHVGLGGVGGGMYFSVFVGVWDSSQILEEEIRQIRY